MLFFLKFQRNNRQNALWILTRGKLEKKLYFQRVLEMKQPSTLIEPQDFIGCLGVFKWRRGWDSNPRTSSSPVTRFRVERVTAASLPLRPAKDFSGSWHKEQEGVNPNPLSSLLEGELLHMGPQRNPFLLEWPLIVSGHDNFIFS